jgi:predicted phosphoribosyltransferase
LSSAVRASTSGAPDRSPTAAAYRRLVSDSFTKCSWLDRKLRQSSIESKERRMARFRDRREAGRRLTPLLRDYAERADVVVLALPRGGIPVGFEIARALHAPFDSFAVRKIGVPGQEELAMGALAGAGEVVVDRTLIETLGLSKADVARVIERERVELTRRQRLYRDHRPYPPVAGNVVILVDDGLATGASMLAAVDALRHMHPAQIVVAVPVAPEQTCRVLRGQVDDVICCQTPEPFIAVGAWYDDFDQIDDREVRRLLTQAHLLRARNVRGLPDA